MQEQHKTFLMNSRQGIATLPTIMALTILILAIGIGITTLSFTEIFISAGQNQSTRAYLFAEAGAKDALERIVRDKKYNCPTTDCYSIDFATSGCATAAGCAKVSVSDGVGSVADPKIIISKGQAGSSFRTVEVDVNFDSSLYGEITTTTWKEITN